jgi:taurine dioxygenase
MRALQAWRAGSSVFISAARRQGAFEQRAKRRLGPAVRVAGPQKPLGRVMTQVDSAEFPDKLVHIQAAAQVPARDGFLNEPLEQRAPFAFHGENLIADSTFHVVEFEQSGSHGTASGEARFLRPSKPVADQSLQLWKPFARVHGGLHHAGPGHLGRAQEQCDLQFLLGTEMGEKPALGHAGLTGQQSERDSFEPAPAHQRQAPLQNAAARGRAGGSHARQNSTTGRSASICLGAVSNSGMNIVLAGEALAAEVQGIDLQDIGDEDFAAIHRAWLDHLVLLARGQRLTDQDLIRFSRRLGELDWAPVQETGRRFVEGHPEIYVVSNVIENGVPIGSLGAGEAVWHTDMSYLDVPPKASMLYALEVPGAGGNTYFCNMVRAYDCLPDALKSRIAGLTLKHDGTYNSGGYVRQGLTAVDDPASSPGAWHPLAPVHPETGRRVLYLGRRRNAYIGGLPLAESEALLDELWSRATRDEFVWGHEWLPGDVVLWDNRSTMHRRDAFDPALRRILHRTQIQGGQRPAA